MLKVTIAELERNSIKRLGVNWSGAAFGGSKVGFTTGNEFPVTGGTGVNTFGIGLAGTDATACSAAGAVIGSLANPIAAGSTCLGQQVEAFERSGVLRTLAEPTLVAISGETASFLAGGEFPIPVAQDNGTLSIEFKPFGVGLAFTPFVASSQRISLKINTEVSELSDEGAISVGFVSVRGLKVRRASTTVELPSGGSMVLAGLIFG